MYDAQINPKYDGTIEKISYSDNGTKEMNEKSLKTPRMIKNFACH